MRNWNVLEDEGTNLAKRLVTMKLLNESPEVIVDHAIEHRDHLLGATLYLLGMASVMVPSPEIWQEVLREE